ncbi:acyl-CoA dehydrogenase [Sphingopyxis lindanitolerans]|uniref:Acyl-CoA dehydrogenase n=2 Tax=Sphingopyxis lindanitolerans TaxID=2054227 RepID=A0A2S8B3H5_9SPHN|nr:acyl-CoA dehydrogenase [Sphingopyxis lindanitolerans]
MLRDSARRYLADDFAARQRGDQAAAWRGYADLGWLALLAPDDAGGLGGDIEDVLILAEEMGRALSLQSYVASAILATGLVDLVASGQQRLDLLAAITSGDQRFAPALYEPGRRYLLEPETRAAASGSGYRISGAKSLIAGGPGADALLVSARLDDGSIGLFLVALDEAAASASHYATIDDGGASDVWFEQLDLGADALLGVTTVAAIDDVLDEARLALCADALGALERAVSITADYLKTRTQFGQPLANFQALQHSIVDIHIDADSIRSSLYNAIATFHRGARNDRRRAVSSCWVKTFDAAKGIAGMAVHLHGGIGMTTEYPVGHYLRRVMVSERSFGDVEYHLARYMELAG